MSAPILATDESQGRREKFFGSPIDRGPVAQGLRSPPVSSVRRAATGSTRFLPECA
jgi:hypothetical protein